MTIRRKYHCDNPDCPHEKQKKMSDWVRKNLPDGQKFYVTDLDFVLYDPKGCGKIMLVEVKTYNGELTGAQKTIKRKMVRFFEQGFNSYPNGCKFLGFHVIRFERDSFISGKCFLDDKEVTEKELIEFLSMGVK